MKKKKAFTLIELMSVVIILGLISVIALPIINDQVKRNKEKLYEIQITNIEKAAENWTYKNAELLPKTNGERVTVTLGQLKQGKFLDMNISDPRTKERFPNDMVVIIERQNNQYRFEVDRTSGTKEFFTTFDENAPTIVLNGDYIQYVEINSPYIEKGAFAKGKSGLDITSTIRKEYYQDKSEVSTISTTTFNTYTVHYIVSENEISSKAIRTVIIRDTTPPELIVPENITISKEEASKFDAMSGVSATDNSGLSVNIQVQNQLSNTAGRYVLTYIATDQSENKTTKKRIITVE